MSHAAVKEAAVIGVPDPKFGEAVMAFVICQESKDLPSKDDLISHCRTLTASYKKPRHIRFVDQLPRNTS